MTTDRRGPPPHLVRQDAWRLVCWLALTAGVYLGVVLVSANGALACLVTLAFGLWLFLRPPFAHLRDLLAGPAPAAARGARRLGRA